MWYLDDNEAIHMDSILNTTRQLYEIHIRLHRPYVVSLLVHSADIRQQHVPIPVFSAASIVSVSNRSMHSTSAVDTLAVDRLRWETTLALKMA